MKHFNFDHEKIKQLPSYKDIISLGWRDTTTPAQLSHGNIDFSGNPDVADDKITVFAQGVIRGYSAETNWPSATSKWRNLRPYRVKKDLPPVQTEKDYELMFDIAYTYLAKRIHRYDKWMLKNAKDLIRVFFDEESERVILRNKWVSSKDFYSAFSYAIKKLHDPTI